MFNLFKSTKNTSIFDLMDHKNLVVTGSAALDYYLYGEIRYANDVDILAFKSSDLYRVQRYIVDNKIGKVERRINDYPSVSFYYRGYDNTLYNIFDFNKNLNPNEEVKNISNLVGNFDLYCSMVMYDGNEFKFPHTLAKEYFDKGFIGISHNGKQEWLYGPSGRDGLTGKDKILKRIKKYKDRGFQLDEQLFKMTLEA